jgi:hypothetical protein
MKKLFYFILTMQIMFTACAIDAPSDTFDVKWDLVKSKYAEYKYICSSVSDAIEYPETWTNEMAEVFVIPDETIRLMSTCGLLETCLSHPQKVLGPWNTLSSSLNYPGVSAFNNEIKNDKVVIELFSRTDCVFVLATKYLSMIEQKEEKTPIERCFEMLIASDLCMSILNEEERNQFMIMALKMMERDKEHVNETRHIMVAIMKVCNYISFLKEAEKYPVSFIDGQRTGFSEWLNGYDVCSYDIVEKYARHFLNN